MSVSVAIANPKGGVGKSLTTMMLADGLALSYGARILVIDADPQAGVTKSLLGIGAEQELRRSQIGLSAILQAFSRGEDRWPHTSTLRATWLSSAVDSPV